MRISAIKTLNLKILVAILPVFIFALFLALKIFSPETYFQTVQEDTFIEYLQILFYFLAAILTFASAKFFTKLNLTLLCILYIILGIGLLFVSIEEFSWGQRIFGIQNPTYFEHNNFQKELSIHNLNAIQPLLHIIYILVGAFGSLAWIITKLPLLRCAPSANLQSRFLAPDFYIAPYFLIIFIIYFTLEFLATPSANSFLIWRDQEPAELILSSGFLIFAIDNYFRASVLKKP